MKQMPRLGDARPPSMIPGTPLTAIDHRGVSAGRIVAALAQNPDVRQFLTENPHLKLSDVKAALALGSSALLEAVAGGAKQSADAVVSVRGPGLPEPDGPMHQISVFRSIIAPLKPGTLLDLGAEKRGFPLTAAHLGWQVTSVSTGTDAQSTPEDEDDPAPDRLEERVSWVEAGVDDFPFERGEYDLIVIHGLLHHLEFNAQAALLRRCAGTPLLINAKVAGSNADRVGRYEGMIVRDQFSSLDGIGRIAPEQPVSDYADEKAGFLLTEDSLIQLARDSGYPIVLVTRPPHRRDNTFYFCLPKNWEAASEGKRRAKRLQRRDGVERMARVAS